MPRKPLISSRPRRITHRLPSKPSLLRQLIDPAKNLHHPRQSRRDRRSGHVTLDGEDVPGFMEAMTMDYKLKDPSVASELHPGDRITATVLADRAGNDYTNVQLDNIVVIAQATPRLQARRVLSRPHPRRRRPRLPSPQSERPHHPPRPVQGQARSPHLHLHPLPTRRLLPPHEPQLRRHRQSPRRRSLLSTIRPTSSASASIPPTTRRRSFAATAAPTPATTPMKNFSTGTSPRPRKKIFPPSRSSSTSASPQATTNHSPTPSPPSSSARMARSSTGIPTNDWKPEDLVATIRKNVG